MAVKLCGQKMESVKEIRSGSDLYLLAGAELRGLRGRSTFEVIADDNKLSIVNASKTVYSLRVFVYESKLDYIRLESAEYFSTQVSGGNCWWADLKNCVPNCQSGYVLVELSDTYKACGDSYKLLLGFAWDDSGKLAITDIGTIDLFDVFSAVMVLGE